MKGKLFGNHELYKAQTEYRKCVNRIALIGRNCDSRSEAVTEMWTHINKIIELGFSCPYYNQDIHEAEMQVLCRRHNIRMEAN